MARRQGQIDERKREAVLDAAATLFAEKGMAVSMEETSEKLKGRPVVTWLKW